MLGFSTVGLQATQGSQQPTIEVGLPHAIIVSIPVFKLSIVKDLHSMMLLVSKLV